MADILTQKRTSEVVLQPLSGGTGKDARQFILYGLKQEDVSWKVYSPTKRSVATEVLTQQRRVSRRQVTLQFSIHEPLTNTVDPTRQAIKYSGIYEKNSGIFGRITAQAQLDLIHALAKLQETGEHFLYSGIVISLARCAIISFDSTTVYATGTGTLILEERPEAVIDYTKVFITAEDEAAALASIANYGGLQENVDETLDNLVNDTYSDSALDCLVWNHLINRGFGNVASFATASTSSDLLNQFGLACLPILVTMDEGVGVYIMPKDSANPSPTPFIVDLSGFRIGETSKAVFHSGGWLGLGSTTFASGHAIVVPIAGYYIAFQFYDEHLNNTWRVTADLFEGKVGPVIDKHESVAPQIDEDCPAQPVRQAQSTKVSSKPKFTRDVLVEFGKETFLADTISFTFVGVGGGPPAIPDGQKKPSLSQYALVIADYRTS